MDFDSKQTMYPHHRQSAADDNESCSGFCYRRTPIRPAGWMWLFLWPSCCILSWSLVQLPHYRSDPNPHFSH